MSVTIDLSSYTTTHTLRQVVGTVKLTTMLDTIMNTTYDSDDDTLLRSTDTTTTVNTTHDTTLPVPVPVLCSREQIRNGHWKKIQRERAPYISKEPWESSCYRKNGIRENQLEQSPFQDWEWNIHMNIDNTLDHNTIIDKEKDEETDTEKSKNTNHHHCVFQSHFDVHRFCQLTINRTIAFLGDSITWQQFRSLNWLVNATDIQSGTTIHRTEACHQYSSNYKSHEDDSEQNENNHNHNNNHTTSRNRNTHQPTQLIWIRDTGTGVTANGLHKIIQLSYQDPDVILINSGIHYTDNDTVLRQLNETLHRALEWQTKCDARTRTQQQLNHKHNQRNCLLLWRTTAPGFPKCDVHQVSGPLQGPHRSSVAERIIRNHSLYTTTAQQHFHWYDIPSQNVLVEEFLQSYMRHSSLRISILDFYDLAILRPDGHVRPTPTGRKQDCLHWCLPGPIDAANTLLVHEMERNFLG
eukprot:CAMPEP_0170973720 /NCGR_PEP_ID=MMETSP0735-20130129/46909_1 /TAXON_ID=186038 /ORGANISM="Fragilariopsis kerguelensis, Strain L26-C5" /LENGTH=466 /DNA_ID=CAMNT_0011394769 /DNA_START=202 /DNA_END=1602 /DNA_ORIENTATION=+